MQIINTKLAVAEDTENGVAVELFESKGADYPYRVRILDTDAEMNVGIKMFNDLSSANDYFSLRRK